MLLLHCIYFIEIFLVIKSTYNFEINKNILYAVKEETEIGTFIGNLNIDSNIAKLQPKSVFNLYDDGKLLKLFNLEEKTGKLSIAQRIDREQICPTSFTVLDRCVIELTVFVPSDFWITVVITIQDVNDHEPKFAENFYQVQISEAVQVGYRISLRTASDPDVEPNNVCNYTMFGFNNTFNIVFSNLLYLIVTASLDYETKSNYKTTLVAYDCGSPPRWGNQTLIISILDINDNKPVFLQKEYKVTILESTMVGEVVANVTAIDADSGLFGQVRYRFGQVQDSSILSYFYISTYTGEIKLQRVLNCRNIAQDFSISIEATDGGNVPKVGYVTVYIHLVDVNNQRPSININSLGPDKKEYIVKENQTVMSYFAIIWVSDGDIGINAKVDCKLTVGEDNFKLSNSQSVKGRDIYTLQPKRVFDREIEHHFQVRIICSDRGSPKLTTEEEITVKIYDVNEYPPKFPKDNYYITMPENVTNGKLLMQMQATDEDATAKLIYEIATGYKDLVMIDPVMGHLRTVKPLDREKFEKIEVKVLAIDTGEPRVLTATATIYITLTDINDNSPQLINRPNIMINENENNFPKFLAQLQAEDLDIGENGTVKFSIQNIIGKVSAFFQTADNVNNFTNLFFIDKSTGNISLLRSLDREQIDQYTIFVEIYDQGKPRLTSVEAIIVKVLDVNDNPPKWVHPTHDSSYINTSTSLAKDQRIIIAQAIDPDSPLNANITYHITEERGIIYIDPHSGEIRTLKNVDEGEYVIKLVANDNGIPNLSTEISIKLFVSSRIYSSTIMNFSDDQFRMIIVVAAVVMGGVMLVAFFIFLMFMKRRSTKTQLDRGKYKAAEVAIGGSLDGFCGTDERWADVSYSPVTTMWYGTTNSNFNPTNYSLQDIKSETSKIFCNADSIDGSNNNYRLINNRNFFAGHDASAGLNYHDPLLRDINSENMGNYISSSTTYMPPTEPSKTLFFTQTPSYSYINLSPSSNHFNSYNVPTGSVASNTISHTLYRNNPYHTDEYNQFKTTKI